MIMSEERKVIMTVLHADGDAIVTSVYCPECAASLDSVKKPTVCKHCGQQLDWTEVEKIEGRH